MAREANSRLFQESHSRIRLAIGVIALLLTLLAACSTAAGKFGQKAKEEAPAGDPTLCVETDPHPVGESIAAKFEVEYEQVMGWFCEGESFDDILLALQTSQLSDRTVEELLERKDQVGWEVIWEELDLGPPPAVN